MSASNQVVITDGGEAIGTLHQFAAQLGRSRSLIFRCTKQAPSALIFSQSDRDDWLLVLDPHAVSSLVQCVREERDATLRPTCHQQAM